MLPNYSLDDLLPVQEVSLPIYSSSSGFQVGIINNSVFSERKSQDEPVDPTNGKQLASFGRLVAQLKRRSRSNSTQLDRSVGATP